MGLKAVTGRIYLVGFIGDQGAETMCLEEKVEGREEPVRTLLGVDCNHPHTS